MAKKKDNLKEGMDLNSELATLSESLRVLKFNIQGSKSKNVKEGASLRRQIARVMTAINRAKTK